MTRGGFTFQLCLGAALLGTLALAPQPAAAQALPEIRISERSKVPACVTPDRLMRFLRSGNERLLPKFNDIAEHYRKHGEANKVRWDYAFFQMILETNYLKFKNAAGQGDVDPKQNNFAGIGTTGGGVPGDNFPDVSTGVLAQLQHLIAYSGERIENPVGRRTREKQDEIIQRSRMLGRPVTFKDLTRRWAVDHRYGSSIAFVAGRFMDRHCSGRQDETADAAAAGAAGIDASDEAGETADRSDARGRRSARDRRDGRSWREARNERRGRANRRAEPADDEESDTGGKPSGTELARRAMESEDGESNRRSSLGAPALIEAPKVAQRPTGCRVFTASYGGEKNVLIRAMIGNEWHYTALQVIDGQESELARYFIASHAKGGDSLGEFASRDAALGKAFDLCPTAEKQAE